MKRRRFAVGQAIVWSGQEWVQDADVPAGLKRSAVYHVLGYYHKIVDGKRYLFLREIGKGKGYDERGFCPAIEATDEALADLLKEVFTPVTV